LTDERSPSNGGGGNYKKQPAVFSLTILAALSKKIKAPAVERNGPGVVQRE
jgi:hypothetical protein